VQDRSQAHGTKDIPTKTVQKGTARQQQMRVTANGPALCRLNFLERRLVDSYSTVIIPFDECVLVVSPLNCTEFSSRLSEVAQTFDAISGAQFLTGGGGLGERWSLGTV
jgi:hypothetical protein